MTNEVDVITFRPGVAKDIVANVSKIMYDNNCIIVNEKNVDKTLNGVSADATKENANATRNAIVQQAEELRVQGICDIAGASTNLAIVTGFEIKGGYDTYQINKNNNRMLNVKALRDAPRLPPGASPALASDGQAPVPAGALSEKTEALLGPDSSDLAVSAGTFKERIKDNNSEVYGAAREDAIKNGAKFEAKIEDTIKALERRSTELNNLAQANSMRSNTFSTMVTSFAKGTEAIIGANLKLSEASYQSAKVLADFLVSVAQKSRKATDEGVDFAVRNTQSSLSAMEGTLYGSNYKN